MAAIRTGDGSGGILQVEFKFVFCRGETRLRTRLFEAMKGGLGKARSILPGPFSIVESSVSKDNDLVGIEPVKLGAHRNSDAHSESMHVIAKYETVGSNLRAQMLSGLHGTG
jgi:hypothetical protein